MKLKKFFHGIASGLKKVKIGKIKTAKIKENKFTKSLNRLLSSMLFKTVLVTLLVLIAAIEIVFGVMIYGFKMDNKATDLAKKYLPYPVAVANQNIITYREFEKEKDYIHHFYAATQQSDLDYTSIDKEILNQLIENKLISFQAFRNGVKLGKDEVDASVDQIVEQNGGEEKVNKALDELYGLNLNEFTKLVKTQMLREKVSTQVIARVSASHILIRVDKDSPEDKVSEAKGKIENIKKEIEGGLDFSEAAKKYSEDVGSAEQGGKLDPFSEGEMVEEFSKKAFSTPVGQISEPVRTEFGWHIIKVESKEGKVENSFNEWITELKDKSIVVKFI